MSEDLSRRLSRWSQRKLAARRGAAAPDPGTPDAAAADAAAPDAAELDGGAAAPDVPALPPIEELTAESDYTVFLANTVPESVRRAALRKLWRSDPVFANLDGLVDYDDDYQLVDTAISAAETAYVAGRGYLDEVERKLAHLEPADAASAEESPAEASHGVAVTAESKTAEAPGDQLGGALHQGEDSEDVKLATGSEPE